MEGCWAWDEELIKRFEDTERSRRGVASDPPEPVWLTD